MAHSMGDGRKNDHHVQSGDRNDTLLKGNYFQLRQVTLGNSDQGKMRKSGGCRVISKLANFMKAMGQHMENYTPENTVRSLVVAHG